MVPKINSIKALPDDVDALKAIVQAERVENDRLRAIIKEFQQAQFGCSSEKIDPEQLRLALGRIEPADAKDEADEKKDDATLKASRGRDRHVNRGALPKHLPRIENVIDPTSTLCPCCSGAMHVIGEDTSERLDVVPAQFRVIVTRRPKYGCRACESAVVRAPAPPWLIEGGLPTEQLIAHVIVGRYADHLPLYRQAQIYARQGIDLDRSTLADWIGRAAFELRPIYERLIELLKGSAKLFMDETRAPVLEPGLGRTKGGFFWAMARDDRPWGGKDPPVVIYHYAPGRGGEHALAHLAGFTGTLQVDGYKAYNKLCDPNREGGAIALAFCWSHVRRAYYKIAQSGNAPIAEEALLRIQQLYRIEKDIRGCPPDERRAVRQTRARPILDALHPWLQDQLERVPSGSKIARALRYPLNHWDGLLLYLDDGRIEIDSNTVERSIRPLALSRKNALFGYRDAGGERWAILASLIETAKLSGINPEAWLADVLTRLAGGHRMRDIDDLLPWYWPSAERLAKAA
ncbi:MAG: IS66 family transposase [Pseudomonadota bacterium]